MAPDILVDLGVHLTRSEDGLAAVPMQVVLVVDEQGFVRARLGPAPALDKVGAAPHRLREYLELQAREQSRGEPEPSGHEFRQRASELRRRALAVVLGCDHAPPGQSFTGLVVGMACVECIERAFGAERG